MRVALVVLSFLCFSSSAALASFAACKNYFPISQPPALPAKTDQFEICFDGFAVLYSGTSKTPVYAVERLSRARIIEAQAEQRSNHFYEEARLPAKARGQLDDYKGSGYDRGHMAPAGDMGSPASMTQSFSLANMVPQNPAHNRKTWNKIEQATRKYAMRASGDIYVFTGPWFAQGPVSTIGKNAIWVPSVTWKLVYDPSTNKAWAYWTENREQDEIAPPISYTEFIKRTGLHLLPLSAG